MVTLYHNPYSQHCRRVVALMEEAGIDYDLVHVALDKGEHFGDAFTAINPNHQVPALIDGDVTLFESNAILRYLCAKHGLAEWYPDDPATRASIDQWLDWNQSRLSPRVIDVVLNKVFMGDQGDKAAIARGEKALPELGAILNAGLKGHDFLAGDRPTIADLSVASNVTQLGFAEAVPDEPQLGPWYDRVSALPGFQKSMPRG
ncbi:MAG: glutathione S-transferase family protein [Pseudomonadota bacterium]